MSTDPQLIEIINNHTRTIEQLTGIIEAQRLMIEDLYAQVHTDADVFRQHAEELMSLPERGQTPGVDAELLELRRETRENHLSRALQSAADRIARRHR